MISNDSSWNYFRNDPGYSSELKDRLTDGVEMESAKAMAYYINEYFRGDLHAIDFGGGPGHYYPTIKSRYTHGNLRYTSVDIDKDNIEFGRKYFREDACVDLRVGSVLDPGLSYSGENCVISANTLPHLPTVEPIFRLLSSPEANSVKYFAFRMLIGLECVQIKKHLRENDFDEMFLEDYQHNNIYSIKYLQWLLGDGWRLIVAPDFFNEDALKGHKMAARESDAYYTNRVSRVVGSLVFKGEVFMPWKFVIGQRLAR